MRTMSANEADDIISELGTAEVSRRYGFGPVPMGPPDRLTCIENAERDKRIAAILAPALAQIERAFPQRRK